MVTAINTSINNLVNPRSARGYFKTQVPNIESIKAWYTGIAKGEEEPFRSLNLLCRQTIDNGYRIIISDSLPIPYVFKYKGETIKSLHEYRTVHIQSSLIRSVLLDGDGQIDARINRIIYILYNYWLLHKDSITEITFNVCVDIECIISTLIDKGFTLYRDYTITGPLVDRLRDKLINEKLINLGDIWY